MSELREFVSKKLAEAFSDQWDPKRPTKAEAVFDGERVGLKFLACTRDGTWKLVHEEPAVPVSTPSDVDDVLARGLSALLMKHQSWRG